MIIAGIILFLVTINVDLYTDLKRWKKGKAVNHKRGALLRLIGLLPAVYLIGWWIAPSAFFLYWTLFDGLYNTLRNYGWWFTGSDDKDDAATDNFLQRLKLWQHIAVKLGGLAGSLIIYIIKVL